MNSAYVNLLPDEMYYMKDEPVDMRMWYSYVPLYVLLIILFAHGKEGVEYFAFWAVCLFFFWLSYKSAIS